MVYNLNDSRQTTHTVPPITNTTIRPSTTAKYIIYTNRAYYPSSSSQSIIITPRAQIRPIDRLASSARQSILILSRSRARVCVCADARLWLLAARCRYIPIVRRLSISRLARAAALGRLSYYYRTHITSLSSSRSP